MRASVLAPYTRGQSVGAATLNQALTSACDLLRSHVHVTPTGEVGWYRQVNRTDRVGIVATAQAVRSFAAAGQAAPRLPEVVRTLLSLQRPAGSWPFISTLADHDVVDSTCWTILALQDARSDPACLGLQPAVDSAVSRATTWLMSVARAGGGWGITGTSDFRVYSTALAVRSLISAGARGHAATDAALQKLLSVSDAPTGAWSDVRGSLSVPITAQVVLALVEAETPAVRYTQQVDRAVHWLSSLAVSTDYWCAGPYVGYHEEVEVGVGVTRARVEYGYSPGAAAVTAICTSGASIAPTVLPISRLLADATAQRWSRLSGQHRAELTTWMLHDFVACVSAFRARLGAPDNEVWSNGSRVVQGRQSQAWPIRVAVRHWPALLTVALVALFVYACEAAGLVEGPYLAAVAFVVLNVTLSIAGNVATSYLRGR